MRHANNMPFKNRFMIKHIGIIGISSEGAALCYTTICRYSWEKLGKFIQPQISLHSHSLKDYIEFIQSHDWDKVGELMVLSAEQLSKAGADFAICPDNTVHMAFNMLNKKSPIPILSIIEITAKECASRGFKKVGLLGTKFTMESDLFNSTLSKYGIETITPNEFKMDTINSIIFNELGPGQINNTIGLKLVPFIEDLKMQGCNAIILGCTELPLVLDDKNSPLPTIATTTLLAKKALEYAL